MDHVAIYPQLPLHYLQSIRLVHALAESQYAICIPPEHQDKFAHLVDVFNLTYRTDIENCHALEGLEISHKDPQTSVGSIHRSLIFPHAILDMCRTMWSQNRPIKYSFAGLITEQRRATLQAWVSQISNGAGELPKLPNTVALPKLVTKVLGRFGFRPSPLATVTKVAVGDLLLWSSTRGRAYPYKAWDEEYFQLLADSAFVLCPSGDFIWTYRFFEAVMCGAIPIVEQACDAYTGFHYYSMQQPMASYVRSDEMVLENYRLCRERITIPRNQLDAEIASLLQKTATVPRS